MFIKWFVFFLIRGSRFCIYHKHTDKHTKWESEAELRFVSFSCVLHSHCTQQLCLLFRRATSHIHKIKQPAPNKWMAANDNNNKNWSEKTKKKSESRTIAHRSHTLFFPYALDCVSYSRVDPDPAILACSHIQIEVIRTLSHRSLCIDSGIMFMYLKPWRKKLSRRATHFLSCCFRYSQNALTKFMDTLSVRCTLYETHSLTIHCMLIYWKQLFNPRNRSWKFIHSILLPSSEIFDLNFCFVLFVCEGTEFSLFFQLQHWN